MDGFEPVAGADVETERRGCGGRVDGAGGGVGGGVGGGGGGGVVESVGRGGIASAGGAADRVGPEPAVACVGRGDHGLSRARVEGDCRLSSTAVGTAGDCALAGGRPPASVTGGDGDDLASVVGGDEGESEPAVGDDDDTSATVGGEGTHVASATCSSPPPPARPSAVVPATTPRTATTARIGATATLDGWRCRPRCRHGRAARGGWLPSGHLCRATVVHPFHCRTPGSTGYQPGRGHPNGWRVPETIAILPIRFRSRRSATVGHRSR